MWCQSKGDRCDRCGARMANGRRLCVTESDRAKAIQRLLHGHRIRIPPPRIGDRVERVLASVGITEERVKKVFGVKDCGCSGRKKKLNDVSEEVAFRAESLLNKALDFFVGDMVSEEAERMARNITERMSNGRSSLPDRQ